MHQPLSGIGSDRGAFDVLMPPRVRVARFGEGEMARLLGVTFVGLFLAAAGIAFFGARGAWDAGLTMGATVLLVTGAVLFLLLSLSMRQAGRVEAERAAAEIVERLNEPAALTDGKGTLIASNAAYRRLHGAVSPILVAVKAGDEVAVSRIRRLLADFRGGNLEVEIEARRSLLQVAPCRSGLLWTLSDARDARTERAVGEESALWLAAQGLSAIEVGVAVADPEGAIVLLNEQLATWLGVTTGAEIPALTARSLFNDSRTELETGGGGTLVKQVVDGVGGSRIVLVRRPAFADQPTEDGDPILVEALFDAAPVGLAVVESDGRLAEFNKAFRRFAPNRNPKRGDRIDSYVAQDDRSEILARLEQTIAGKAPSRPLEVNFNTQPARTGQVFFSLLGGRESKGALVHLIDTTQHKSLERQFVQAQKMQAVGQLAGGVAHDFNNLLTAIIGFCDLLLVRHGPGDQSFSDIMQIKQNANRAANLVRQLLAFSRQQTMRPKVLVITDVLADLSNLLRRLIGETIELKMIHGRDVGAVRVDRGQLEQVIINLVVNARDAMPDGGTLTIRTKAVGPEDSLVQHYSVMPPADYVLIEVTDTGTGIPAEHINKIFEPFFTTKNVGKGTGLGLSTVYGIIKQTGGYIFVESAPGEGATFRVYLPVHELEEEEQEEGEEKPKDLTGKGTILIVEDEDAVRLFAARALGNKGYTVLQAASGEEALDIVRAQQGAIDLMISDVVMPNMDGPTLVDEAHKLCPDMQIIFISGYAEEVFRKSLGRSGQHFAFLPKPFSLKQLAETVKDTLG